MNRNQRGFNLFCGEMPFILPQPIPEPPRVIYPKPMVPDLSITSDMSANVSPKVKIKDNFDKYRTIYPSPPKRESTPNYCMPSFPEQLHDIRPNGIFANRLPSNVNFSEKQNQMNFCPDFETANNENDCNFINRRSDIRVIQTNNKVFDNKPIAVKSVKPKIIRHSSVDPVINQNKSRNKCSAVNPINYQQSNPSTNGSHSPTKEQMLQLIKQQDKQLQQISEQIQELLRFHKIQENKSNSSKNTRSVMTMTSMVFDDNHNSPSTRPKTRLSKPIKSSSKTPSTTSRDIRGLHLRTISECQTDPSEPDLDLNRLNLSESPVRHHSPYFKDNGSIERIRGQDMSNECDEHFYDHMMGNINSMLNNPSSDETDDTGRRSSCSPTPPHLKRDSNHRKHQIHLQSEQTLYIKKLAAKYSIDDNSDQRRHSHRTRKTEQTFDRNNKTDLKVYGFSKNTSIATKNYLEKYGLTNSPPKVQKTHNFHENRFTNHNHMQQKSNRNRILDLEVLKRQPKLT